MDVNGTRHHLLLGREDWSVRTLAEPPRSAAYDPEREELTLRPLEFRFSLRRGDRTPELADRRGAGRDAFGNVYWIGADRRSIRVQPRGGSPSTFWRTGSDDGAPHDRERGGFAARVAVEPPRRATTLAGLAVTEDHHLVAGTLEPAGIVVFDLHGSGPPRHERWPDAVAFVPFDMCARTGGGAFVLDRLNTRLWELDRHLHVVTRRDAAQEHQPSEFAPLGADPPAPPDPAPPEPAPPEPAPRAHRRILAEDGVLVGGDPVSVETAPAGAVLLLDRNDGAPPSTVRLLAHGVPQGAPVGLEEPLPDDGTPDPTRLVAVAHDMALVAGPGIGTLYVADREGNQAFAFALELEGGELRAAVAHDHFPMRSFGGKGLVGGPDGALYDFDDGWFPLARQGRPRHVTSATLRTPAFDGREHGTVWHRLLIDACIPPETSIAVESRAADERRELADAPWQPEPALVYHRSDGSELPFVDDAARGGYETWEILFQRARGRFLELRLALSGSGRATPRLRALRAYYPRCSYLERYLPRVYGEDPESASFVERLLANLEGMQTGIEERIANAQALFDPRTAPADTLDWLLGWFDLAADPTWHEQRRRLLLSHATEFLALRGTVLGIQLALRLALDPCDDDGLFAPDSPQRRTSRIVERFRSRPAPAFARGAAGDATVPRVVGAGGRWEPTQGGELLRADWRELTGDPAAEPPLRSDTEPWRTFVRQRLGIDPPGAFADALWTSFLATRYARIAELDAAYGLVGEQAHGSFEAVAPPSQLPPDGAPLRDWYDFAAIVLPAHRSAHRFTVFLPMPAAGEDGRSAEERRAIALRVVELQKPAHTTFDVRFFWAAFRLGEARIGDDTLLDLGSRDPRLRQPVVLGREHVGESTLGGRPAPTAGATGRDTLNR